MPSDIIFRPALYLGSVHFDADKYSRAEFVHNKLEELQKCLFFKPVKLCISTSGVKVCNPDCKTIYMAHALRRISYATCNPYSSKFAFLAREANSETPCQYCHIFGTETQFQAEELNTIIGDAFKLAYAKQQQSSTDAQLPTLSTLHPVELLLPSPSRKTEGHCVAPPLHIPPPPPTTPPSPPLSGVTSISCTCQEKKEEVEQQYNGSNLNPVSSGLHRHWLQEEGEEEANGQAAQVGSEHGGVAERQLAFSDPRAPCPRLLQQPQNQNLPLARHSVAFFDAPSPATPKFAGLQSPQASPLSLPITPVSIKNKHRAIFDLPFDDHPLATVATNPVVALKTHIDAVASESKKTPVKQVSHQKKSDSSFPSSGNAVVSRFRLRQGGGSGGGGGRGKKRQLERPLSQIICHLDSALLLNNSPSFNVQPRSEERLSTVDPPSNSHSTVAEETGGAEFDDVMSVPLALFQYLDDMENPPTPPLRLHSLPSNGEEVNQPSEASTHHDVSHRKGGAPPQGLEVGVDYMHREADGEVEAAEFALLQEATSTAVEEGGVMGMKTASAAVASAAVTTVSASQLNYQLADVCPIASFSGSTITCGREISRPCPLHAGLESSSSSSHNGSTSSSGSGSNQHSQPQAVGDGGWRGGQEDSRLTPKLFLQQQPSHHRHQMDRWAEETPTPTATPTPTPNQAPLLSSQHPAPPWFQAYLPREVALELLTHEEAGSFLVRDSVTQPGYWALSVRVPTHVNCIGITHYLIQHSRHGVKLKGLDKEWPSLEALITHLTVMPEMLPCPLRLPPSAHSAALEGIHRHHQASNPTFTEEEERDGTAGTIGVVEEDKEYQRLSDFSSMLADMQPTSVMPHLFR